MTDKKTTSKTDDDKPAADKAKGPELTPEQRDAGTLAGSPKDAPSKDPSAPGERPETETTPGHPEPLAQIKHTSTPSVATSLLSALNELPQLPQLDGVRANLPHYETHPDELAKLLESLPIPKDNATGLAARDALVARVKAREI